MFTLILCLFIACLLPYFVKLIMAYPMAKEPGGYDNNHPRAQEARLTGFGARAYAAHNNCFESLMIFSTASLTAIATNHLSMTMQYLAITYLISRFIYVAFYLMNLASLRSAIWSIGMVSCMSMLWLCLP